MFEVEFGPIRKQGLFGLKTPAIVELIIICHLCKFQLYKLKRDPTLMVHQVGTFFNSRTQITSSYSAFLSMTSRQFYGQFTYHSIENLILYKTVLICSR